MAFTGAVFGLKDSYNSQVENFVNNNLNYWPEPDLPSRSALPSRSFKTTGYFLGGNSLSGMSSTYMKFSFSNETFNGPYSMGVTRGWAAYTATNQYAYFGGGYSSFPEPQGITSQFLRMDFSSESFSTPSSYLQFPGPSGGTRRGTAVFSSNYGYYCGAFPPTNIVTRLDYFTETTTAPPVRLGGGGSYGGFQASSPQYGYFGGGYTRDIYVLDFNTENMTLYPNIVPTPLTHSSYVTGQNNLYSYIAGGGDAGPTGKTSAIHRIDFSNNTVGTPGKSLSEARNTFNGFSSTDYAYFGGGYNPSNQEKFNITDRMEFATENNSATSGMPEARAGHFSASNSN